MCVLCEVVREQNPEGKKPWEDNPVGVGMKSWLRQKRKAEDFLMTRGVLATIDEVALQFPSRNVAAEYIMSAVEEDGVSLFNHALDVVKTGPWNTTYAVEYFFLASVDSPLRIECMSIAKGISPLHVAMGSHAGENKPIAVHLSWKEHNYADYVQVLDRLDEAGFDMAQECNSTYGAFSYWTSKEWVQQGGANIYLKPRVNMRDSGMVYDFENDLWRLESEEPPVAPEGSGDGMPTLGLGQYL